MKLTATMEDALEVAQGIWHVPTAIDQVLHNSAAERPDFPSVLLVEQTDFDRTSQKLSFDFGAAELLVLGSPSRGTIILAARSDREPADDLPVREEGDEQYLRVLGTMAPHIRPVGEDLMERIRELDPDGKFERHGRRFINRPDNFVALEPQTRIHEIIMHVRGNVSGNLQPVATQRGYSAFKLKSAAELLEAGRILGLATRKF